VEARLQQGSADHLKAIQEKFADEAGLRKAKLELAYHYINSNRNGRVDRIYNRKKPGEVVRASEPLFKIVNDDKLRVEGAVDAHLAGSLKVGAKALVEAERQLTAFRTLRGQHFGPVTDLAVTPDGRFLATASKDQSVILWDWQARTRVTGLPHTEEVHAIACGGATKPNEQGQMTYTFATGCARGRAFLWRVTVDKDGKVVAQKHEELSEKNGKAGKSPHGSSQPVRSVAFDAEGSYCVTGGDDYQICCWKVDGAEFLCRVRETTSPADKAHRGAVTSLAFMKDGHLLSSGGIDKTLKKWKIGQDAAGQWSTELVKEQRDRAAQVTRLGPTADGGRILFDYGDELRILDAVNDWNPLGAFRNPRPGHFQNIERDRGKVWYSWGPGKLLRRECSKGRKLLAF
jgi:hypothetical protein